MRQTLTHQVVDVRFVETKTRILRIQACRCNFELRHKVGQVIASGIIIIGITRRGQAVGSHALRLGDNIESGVCRIVVPKEAFTEFVSSGNNASISTAPKWYDGIFIQQVAVSITVLRDVGVGI